MDNRRYRKKLACMRPVYQGNDCNMEETVKFKVMAYGGISGFKCNVGAGKLNCRKAAHRDASGTASDAVPDIATLAIEVNVAAKDAATAKKSRPMSAWRNIFPFLEQNGAKKTLARRICARSRIMITQNGKSILKEGIARCEPLVTLRQLE